MKDATGSLNRAVAGRLAVVLLLGVLGGGPLHADAYQDTGPLRIRDQFLLNMSLLAFEPDAAVLLAEDHTRVDVVLTASNTFAMSDVVSGALERRDTRRPVTLADLRAVPGNIFYLDAEVYRTGISVDHGISDDLQIGFTWQWLSFIGGAFDGFIEAFHDTFNIEQRDREGVTRGSYITYVRSNGIEVFDNSPPGSGPGDIVLRTKLKLADDVASALSVQASLKLPLGEGDDLFSSGSTDAGAQLLGTYYLSPQACLHYGMGILRLGAWELFGLSSQTLLSGMFGLALETGPAASVIAQVTASQSPFADLDLPELGAVSIQASLGYNHELDRGIILFAALTENIVHFDNTADVGIHLGMSLAF